MTRWRPVWIAIALLLLGSLYARACWEPSIRADERARARDSRDDSTVSRLVYEARTAETKWLRERDSTGRVIRRQSERLSQLLHRGENRSIDGAMREASPDSPIGLSPSNGVPLDYQQSITVRDSLIGALVAGRAQDSLQILFWKAQAATWRDSIAPALQRSRDSWRREASKPRHTLTDIAGGVALGYGLARENEVAAGVGGALILVPRVVDVLARIL